MPPLAGGGALLFGACLHTAWYISCSMSRCPCVKTVGFDLSLWPSIAASWVPGSAGFSAPSGAWSDPQDSVSETQKTTWQSSSFPSVASSFAWLSPSGSCSQSKVQAFLDQCFPLVNWDSVHQVAPGLIHRSQHPNHRKWLDNHLALGLLYGKGGGGCFTVLNAATCPGCPQLNWNPFRPFWLWKGSQECWLKSKPHF